ncbi:MAG: EF-hand domain-containing protein [Betaproteobacteria bacterium]|nr:MAG: EF-hand domain-containing protein [Betaproteobacteria bacterium]TAG46115.1 MAG: EF-hand domain-containing protein [Betaproteobacteria bacterium]
MQKSISQSRDRITLKEPRSRAQPLAAAALLAALLGLGAGSAYAQKSEPMPAAQPPATQSTAPTPGTSTETLFRRIDSDADGAISKAELEKFDPEAAKQFDKYDIDKDGKLTMAEFDAMLKGIRA